MRLIVLVMGFLAVALVACSEGEKPTNAPGAGASFGFHVVSGDRSFPLDVLDSPEKAQDDIVRAAKQLWDELQPGRSVVFRVEGRSGLSLDMERVGEEREGAAARSTTVSGRAQITTTSTSYRMFKDRNGISGIEEAREEPTGPDLRAGPDIGWTEIEEDLRQRAFSTSSLRMMLIRDGDS